MTATTESGELFPRSVFDQDGNYTIRQSGPYIVDAPGANRLSALTSFARDITAAHEMLCLCASAEDDGPQDTTVRQALWVSAIVMYAKGFKRNNARKDLDAKQEIVSKLDAGLALKHKYVMDLRDKYAAHDDGVGEDKVVRMSFPLLSPMYTHEVGIQPGTSRIVSLGTDKANELLPLFFTVVEIVVEARAIEWETLLRNMIRSRFENVKLLGLYEHQKLSI